VDYSVDDFVADYQAAMKAAQNADRADVESGKALRQPFEIRYQGKILRDKMLAFQRVMQAIRRNKTQLVDRGYARLGADSEINWMHRNVVRAFHRLILEQAKRDPSADEIGQTIEFFTSRN